MKNVRNEIHFVAARAQSAFIDHFEIWTVIEPNEKLYTSTVFA